MSTWLLSWLLDPAAPDVDVALELALHGVEGVTDGHVHVLVRMVLVVVRLCHHQLTVRHGEIDANLEQPALVMMGVRRLHHHAAAHDMVIVLLELGGLVADAHLHGLGRLHVAEGDL
jgi:hypothetical protein